MFMGLPKKTINIIISVMFLFLSVLTGCQNQRKNDAEESLLSGEKYQGVVTEYDNNIGKEMTYYVFIKGDEKIDEVNRKIVGDNDFCKRGYLYSKNIRTGEIIQLLTTPVDYHFHEHIAGKVVYAVAKGKIIRTTVLAEYAEELCDMDEHVIRIESSSKQLYVVTDENIYRIAKEDGNREVMLKNDFNCYSALPVSENVVALFCFDGKQDSYYLYDLETETVKKVDESELNSYLFHEKPES